MKNKKYHHYPPCSHKPPFWEKHGAHNAGRHSSEKLFLRFAFVFGLLGLLGCGTIAALVTGAAFLVDHRISHEPRPFHLLIPLIVAIFLFIAGLRLVSRRAARRWFSPLSAIMNAADALAAGDFSARVPLHGDREFRHLAYSFNRMAEALEIAARHRRELLADIAHELRTPLSIVQGNLEGLRDGVYDATPEQLDLILDETHKLSHLIEDLRLLTLAEAGQLPLDFQSLNVSQLLADVRDAFICRADEANITIAVEASAALPPLHADPQRLGQVLNNLVTNALRYTPAGGKITLGAAACAAEIKLWVADTGAGIPPEDLSRIFDRFWRGDPSRTHEEGAGSGLGLAIAKSLIEAHGGRIWAESAVGEGTAISCALPLIQLDD